MSAGLLAAADLVGGAMSYFGQNEANRANAKMARDQMAFQERMSNTAYQRSASDLEKAGLNRVLALGSPASSPPGQSANMQNEFGQIPQSVNAASSKFRMQEEIKLLREQRKNVRSSTNLNDANAVKATAEAAQAEVTKMGWQAVQPFARDLIDAIRGLNANSARSLYDTAVDKTSHAIEATVNSAKSLKDDVFNAVDNVLELKPFDLKPKTPKENVPKSFSTKPLPGETKSAYEARMYRELRKRPYHEIQRRYREMRGEYP